MTGSTAFLDNWRKKGDNGRIAIDGDIFAKGTSVSKFISAASKANRVLALSTWTCVDASQISRLKMSFEGLTFFVFLSRQMSLLSPLSPVFRTRSAQEDNDSHSKVHPRRSTIHNPQTPSSAEGVSPISTHCRHQKPHYSSFAFPRIAFVVSILGGIYYEALFPRPPLQQPLT